MSSNLPAPRPRQRFPEIAAVSWEHPADRAALQTLRAVPGVVAVEPLASRDGAAGFVIESEHGRDVRGELVRRNS